MLPLTKKKKIKRHVLTNLEEKGVERILRENGSTVRESLRGN